VQRIEGEDRCALRGVTAAAAVTPKLAAAWAEYGRRASVGSRRSLRWITLGSFRVIALPTLSPIGLRARHMRRLVALISTGLILSLAAEALAANPVKGGFYSGMKPGVVAHKVTLKVSSTGKSAVANLYCAGAHASTIKDVAISHGNFSGERKSGSAVVWRLTGYFATKTTAKAKANLHSVCSGGTVKLTLTLVHH
jgi:hypothetical protein